jgi:hypothetical protein
VFGVIGPVTASQTKQKEKKNICQHPEDEKEK